MTNCYFCNFQLLKVPDLKTKNGKIYYVHILKSKQRIHDCVYSPKRIPENVRYSTNDCPTVQFLKADNVLKRRFYTICPPIQRKRLWNCSTTCANLGKKPTTLIVGELSSLYFDFLVSESSAAIVNALHMIPSTNTIISTETNKVVLDNFVMDLRYDFHLGLDSKMMAELTRFVDFNQTKVRFNHDHDLTSFYPLIFTTKVTRLVLWDKPEELIWPLLPNLEKLSAYSRIFPVVFKEIIHLPKLTRIQLFINGHLDYSIIAKFLQNQRSNLWFTFVCSSELDLYEKSLLEHFVPVERRTLDRKGLWFIINDNHQFFVLR